MFYIWFMQAHAAKPITVRPYALDERTKKFAWNVRVFIKRIPFQRNTAEDCDQLLRSSGSVGANYIEAKEALSKKDFLFHIRICRKEAKESAFWLEMLKITISEELETERLILATECNEIISIFARIAKTTEANLMKS